MCPIAFNTVFLQGVDVLDAVKLVRDHGYDAVELNAEALPWAEPHVGPATSSQTRADLVKIGPYNSVCAHHADLSQDDDEQRLEAVKWTHAMLEFANDIECDLVHVIPGELGSVAALHRSLAAVLERAEELQVTLALEPIVNHTVSTSEAALAAVAAVPGLRVNFDPSHLQLTDGDIPLAVQRLGEHIAGVAFKDSRGGPSDFAFVPLGEGDVDFVGMVRELRAIGYDGAVGVEHESQLFGDERGHDQVLSESLEFVRRALAS